MNELEMPTRRTLRKRFAFLLGGVMVFLALLARLIEIHEEIYQERRAEGWITYLKVFLQIALYAVERYVPLAGQETEFEFWNVCRFEREPFG